jgi:hypothetical protein
MMRGHKRCQAIDADDRAVDGESYYDREDHPQRNAQVSDAKVGGDGDEDSDGGLGVLWVDGWDWHACLRTGSPWVISAGSRGDLGYLPADLSL